MHDYCVYRVRFGTKSRHNQARPDHVSEAVQSRSHVLFYGPLVAIFAVASLPLMPSSSR